MMTHAAHGNGEPHDVRLAVCREFGYAPCATAVAVACARLPRERAMLA